MSKTQEKWDKRYQAKNEQAGGYQQAPEYLQRNWRRLASGRVLDVAAGDGAASLFLHECGFSPVAIDISNVGLARLQHKLPGAVEVHQCDLESADVDLSSLGAFDAIVISRYKPSASLWPQLVKLLKQGGVILITTFNTLHHERTGFSQRFCLTAKELQNIAPELTVLDYESDVNDSGMDSYLLQKVVTE